MIIAKNLYIQHEKQTFVINLRIKRGEKVVISCEDKVLESYVIKLLCGLEKPKKGWVFLKNRIFSYTMDENYFKQRLIISYFIDGIMPLANLSVYKNIEIPYSINSHYTKEMIESIIKERLSILGMEHLSNLRPDKISREEKELLATAMNLKEKSEFLVFQNVFFYLSPDSISKFQKLLKPYLQDQMTFVVSEADSKFIDGLTSRYKIKNGKLIREEI